MRTAFCFSHSAGGALTVRRHYWLSAEWGMPQWKPVQHSASWRHLWLDFHASSVNMCSVFGVALASRSLPSTLLLLSRNVRTQQFSVLCFGHFSYVFRIFGANHTGILFTIIFYDIISFTVQEISFLLHFCPEHHLCVVCHICAPCINYSTDLE